MNSELKQIRIEEFNYPLPDERIAKYPLPVRDESKLLIYNKGAVAHQHFYNLPELLETGDMLIYNNTKVIQARLRFYKESGAQIEIFCLEPLEPANYEENFAATGQVVWKCMIGNLKKWKEGTLTIAHVVGDRHLELTAERLDDNEGMNHTVRFTWNRHDLTFADVLEVYGELPIPPYLNRKTEEKDKETYQTVYSKIEGSVAAPTAGLHFTPIVLHRIARNGIIEEEVTLHVGAGTFQPVKSETIGEHPMHTEFISINRSTIENIIKHFGHIVAVGTTSVRTLESLYYLGVQLHNKGNEATLHVSQWEAYNDNHTLSTIEALQCIVDYLKQHHEVALHASTQILIAPGFNFRIVNKMITNFHQPKSTLLLLIAAFVGVDRWHDIYNYALNNDFRFLSYGDSSLLIR